MKIQHTYYDNMYTWSYYLINVHIMARQQRQNQRKIGLQLTRQSAFAAKL